MWGLSMPRDGELVAKRRKDPPVQVIDDLGTLERAQHSRLVQSQRLRTDDRGNPLRGEAYGLQDATPTALDRPPIVGPLARESDHETLRQAADRLREDWCAAGIEPSVCGGYGRQSGGEMTDAQALAHRRYTRAMQAIGLPLVRSVVENVVVYDLPDSRVGLLVVGLRQLARYFGLDDRR